MRLVLHPKVYSDIDRIMGYYEQVATSQLANEFYAELRSLMTTIRQGEIRRANLHRFPYHFLFRIAEDVVRILVVRHHRRDPSLGNARR
jgi:plasmid stabilization system protein ParE